MGFRVLPLLVLCLLTTVTAQEACTNTSTVTASGYSSPEAEGQAALQQGLAQALAAAIAQANGTLVQHQSSLETTITTRLRGETRTDDTIDRFRERIEQTTAGFITDFQIINETQEHGLKRVDVRAAVCTDPRATLALRGNMAATSAIEAAILPHLQAGGWRVSVSNHYYAPNQATHALFYTGGTLLLGLTATPVKQETYRGLQRVELEVTGDLTDLRSAERSQAYAFTTEGIGVNQEAALHDAGTRAAAELTRIFQATWALPTGINPSNLNLNFTTRSPARLTFTGVTLANTRYEIRDLLKRTPSVTLQGDLQWDEAAQTLTVTATLTEHPCEVGEALEAARRILLRVRECSERTLTVHVQRE